MQSEQGCLPSVGPRQGDDQTRRKDLSEAMDFSSYTNVAVLETSNDNHSEKMLGSVRLQDAQTKQTILVPQPSNDPRDPLNW